MTTCTIILSHYESFPFLLACVRQIRKYKHPNIDQRIIICEQSSDSTYGGVVREFGGDSDITVVKTASLYSGYGVDYAIRFCGITSDYIAQLHVDAFPIHKNWLYLPIKLIEEDKFAFVGQLHCIGKPTDTIYPPNSPFFSMSPTYNVARASTYREMAMIPGFTRFHNRPRAENGMEWANSDWSNWAKEDYNARGSDDDIPAFLWEDTYREHNKLGLATTGIMGVGDDPGFGRIIEDLVFHFGFGSESVGVMEHMGKNYFNWTQKINENYSDDLIEEMMSISRKNVPYKNINESRSFWNGKLKDHCLPSDELSKKIEELKKL